MSVRRVGPRLRPLASGLAMALVLGGCLGSLAVSSGVGIAAAAGNGPNDPPPTTAPTPPTTTTTPPPPTTTPPPPTSTTGVPRTTTTTNAAPTTTFPGTSSSLPQSTTSTTTTAPQNGPTSTGPVSLAEVVSTGDGLVVTSADGTERPAQVGQDLVQGDRLTTTPPPGAASSTHPATIRWYQGGMTDIYDAKPRIFVRGHTSVPTLQSSVSLDADPTPKLGVSQGFARFWFSSSDKQRYGFVASTDQVVVTVKGTDFTIGEDPASGTSTVGVTLDSVTVAPANPALRPFQLSSGSEVDVTTDRVGPITPLADQSANSPKPRSRSHSTTTLALWLVGLLLGVGVLSGAVGLGSLWRERRRGHAAPVPALPPRPAFSTSQSFTPVGQPLATEWVILPAGSSDDATEPVAATPSSANHSAPTPWEPTHRVPPEGMKARAIPVADAGDVATLDPNQAVRMVEHRGDWANVLSADGWSGWVDARQLRPESGSG